MNFFFVIIYSQ